MRLTKLVTVALATAALAASGASADPGHGKDKDKSPAAPKCKPANVQLKGLLTSDPGASDTSFTMSVLKANHGGKAYKLAGSATVNVDAKTRIHRHAPGVHGNKAMFGDLAMGDAVKVKAKVCRDDLANGATPDLTARKVDARAPKPEKPKPAEPEKKK